MSSKSKDGPGDGGADRNGGMESDAGKVPAGKQKPISPSDAKPTASVVTSPGIIGIGRRQAGQQPPQPADPQHLEPSEILARMRSYWDGLSNGRTIPMRSEIDPRGLRHTLDHAFILERLGPGSARFRLAGRHLIELMGMEVRGMPLATVVHPSSRGQLVDILETVFSAPQIASLSLQDKAQQGKPLLIAQMLLLPLRSDLGDITRALGCLVAEGRVGIPPRRFEITDYQLSPAIAGGRVQRPAFEPVPAPSGFFEADTPWQPGQDLPSPDERRARFRLITGDLDASAPGPGSDGGDSSA